MKSLAIFSKICKQAINKATRGLKMIPWVIAKDAFLFMVLFILLGVAFGEFLLYRYAFLGGSREDKSSQSPIMFQQKTYESVVNKWQERKVIFERFPESYPDPFQ